jgi:sugar (pentulose or hexulose) kinase
VPGPEAKGSVIGFGDVHTRAHLYRAILEGLCFALREGKERNERRSGVAITELRVAGGGSQSDAAMQITADIFGLPASRPHVSEASGLGAAIDVAVGLGIHGSFEAAVKEMTRLGRTFMPRAEVHETYDALYTRVYKQLLPALKPCTTRSVRSPAIRLVPEADVLREAPLVPLRAGPVRAAFRPGPRGARMTA